MFIINFFCESSTMYNNFVKSKLYQKNSSKISTFLNYLHQKFNGNVVVDNNGNSTCNINEPDSTKKMNNNL